MFEFRRSWIIMSKATRLVKKLSRESESFKNAYTEAKLQSDYADILFELEKDSKLSSTEFAQKTNKSRATINRIKNRQMNPTLKTFNEIVEPFGKEVKLVLVDKQD